MKRITTLAAALAMAIAANGQIVKNQVEISASYGINPFQQTMQSLSFGYSPIFTKVTSTTGTPFATVRYFVDEHIAFGVTAGMHSFTTATYDRSQLPATENKSAAYDYKTVAGEIFINCIDRKWYRLYTYFGGGFSSYTQQTSLPATPASPAAKTTDKRISYNMQYVPIGISVGSQICGFAEIGIGYKGFANAGISYRFTAIQNKKHSPEQPS